MATPVQLPCLTAPQLRSCRVAAAPTAQLRSSGRRHTLSCSRNPHQSKALPHIQQPPALASTARSVSCRDSQPGASVQPLQSAEQHPSVDVSVPGGAPVRVFGVRHLEAGCAAAEWIWQTKPSFVVVETALTAAHGAATGSMLSMADHEQRAADNMFRVLSQIAGQLDPQQDLADSPLWQQVKPQLCNEQLVYITALAVGAQLVFGDRIKSATYSRLSALPSIVDLDFAFGSLSASNYQESLSRHQQQLNGNGGSDVNDMNCISIVLTHERNLIMAHSLRDAAIAAGSSSSVVGVIGEGHLSGIYIAFAEEQWLNDAELQLLHHEPSQHQQQSPVDAAVHRALLTSCLALCCPAEILEDFDRWLGPVPPEQQEAYQLTLEIYGSTRMLLAALPKADLSAVCGSWDCDMWEVLAPLRAVRPMNGGPGFDEQLVLELRQLFLEIN